MCQGCVDEGMLSQATFDAINAFNDEWPDAQFGPAHIVLGDDNVGNGSLEWCISLARAALGEGTQGLDERDLASLEYLDWYRDHEPAELRATLAFLNHLLTIPELER